MVKMTERRRTANRANALKSTGPKSLAAKKVTARNAKKHGLSSPPIPVVTEHGEIERMVWALCGPSADKDLLFLGRVFAREFVRYLNYRHSRDTYLEERFRAFDESAREAGEDENEYSRFSDRRARFLSAHADELLRLDLYDRRNRRALKKATRAFLSSLADLQFWRVEERLLDADFAAAIDATPEMPRRSRRFHLPRRPSIIPALPPSNPVPIRRPRHDQ